MEDGAEGPGPALDEPRAHWGSCSLLVSEPCPVSEPGLQPNGWNLCVLFSPRHRLLEAAKPGNPHSSGLVGRVLDVRPCRGPGCGVLAGIDKEEGADVAMTWPGWVAEQDTTARPSSVPALCRLSLWASVPDSVPSLSLPKARTTSLCFSKDQQDRTGSCLPNCFVIFPLRQIVKFQENLPFSPRSNPRMRPRCVTLGDLSLPKSPRGHFMRALAIVQPSPAILS